MYIQSKEEHTRTHTYAHNLEPGRAPRSRPNPMAMAPTICRVCLILVCVRYSFVAPHEYVMRGLDDARDIIYMSTVGRGVSVRGPHHVYRLKKHHQPHGFGFGGCERGDDDDDQIHIDQKQCAPRRSLVENKKICMWLRILSIGLCGNVGFLSGLSSVLHI